MYNASEWISLDLWRFINVLIIIIIIFGVCNICRCFHVRKHRTRKHTKTKAYMVVVCPLTHRQTDRRREKTIASVRVHACTHARTNQCNVAHARTLMQTCTHRLLSLSSDCEAGLDWNTYRSCDIRSRVIAMDLAGYKQ